MVTFSQLAYRKLQGNQQFIDGKSTLFIPFPGIFPAAKSYETCSRCLFLLLFPLELCALLSSAGARSREFQTGRFMPVLEIMAAVMVMFFDMVVAD